ncbi:hypothetical protein FHT44_005000 [Mycolicibacterium sp. BK634]|uniref:hypothetical protein n=1 Tax=Mycolicibacterium sp. BK634 TaxID=2587099 RepID=UPI0016206765|nr:hypothetical protein [Mycolicibacterium sp. BK634]MBB3752488.1 hypothetical protein [Mycolicibacterium sp. BK634]
MTFSVQRVRPRDLQMFAVQWDSEDAAHDIIDWIEVHNGHAYRDEDVSGASGPAGEDWGEFQVETFNGDIDVAPYDFIILGTTGEFFVRKPKSMIELYEVL